jgi:hypothetical protein
MVNEIDGGITPEEGWGRYPNGGTADRPSVAADQPKIAA